MKDFSNFSAREVLRDGSTVTLRAIRADDKPALEDGFGKLTQRSIQWRFFGAKTALSPRELVFLTEIDYDHHMGLVAEDDDGQLVGVGRYVAPPGSDEAELAFVVGEPFQGRGIATAMLRHLRAMAADHGLKAFVALVQPENDDMIDVFRRAGFEVGWSDDGELRTARLPLP